MDRVKRFVAAQRKVEEKGDQVTHAIDGKRKQRERDPQDRNAKDIFGLYVT